MEIPQWVNLAAAKVAKASETQVVFDLGGKDEAVDQKMLQYVDYISPNSTELDKIFTGQKSEKTENEKITGLLKQYEKIKFLHKQGAEGSTLYYRDEQKVDSVK